MLRYAVIFGLLFQSLALILCAGRMPGTAAPTEVQAYAVAPSLSDSAGCCEVEPSLSPAQTRFGVATLSRHSCPCPLTVDTPRVRATPDYRPGAELTRVPVEIATAFVLQLPVRSGQSVSSASVLMHPPGFAGRLVCERFCRWTI